MTREPTMELHYVKLFFTFTLKSDVADPYLLFGCRPGFDAAFRRAVSCRRGHCAGCSSAAGCPYPANFGQALANDPEGLRRHQKPPLPFVFQFPLIPSIPNSGTTLECALTLFGSAVQDAPHFIAAVRLLLDGVPATALKVEAESPGGERATVAAVDQPALPLLSGLDPTGSGPLSPHRVTLAFLSPVKLMQDGRLLKQVSFSPLARALMRRISSLAYYYEGAEPPLDYRWLSQRSEEVHVASTTCRLISWGGRPAGVMGSIAFEGDLEPFHLLLQLGAATHVGKGASFGFGAYRLTP
jgi:hypothetical protein